MEDRKNMAEVIYKYNDKYDKKCRESCIEILWTYTENIIITVKMFKHLRLPTLLLMRQIYNFYSILNNKC